MWSNLKNVVVGEALLTVAYILNGCSTKRLENKVLEEVWLGKKVICESPKSIGSLCLKHIPDARRKKPEDKSELVILIGYHNHVINKIEISRDVKMVKYEAWNWKQIVQNSNCSVNLDDKLSYRENTYDYNDSITQNSFNDQPQVVTRAHRNIQFPKRLVDCDMVSNSVVDEHSEIVSTLYGLKQAPRSWNKRIDGFFLQQGSKKCNVEQ